MKNKKLDIQNYIDAYEVYKKGKNISEFLKKTLDIDYNSSEIIELTYDQQAGRYTKNAELKPDLYSKRAKEIANFLNSNIEAPNSILDVGTGEMTMLLRLLSNLKLTESCQIFASDLSWSRLAIGKKLISKFNHKKDLIKALVAESSLLPFQSKSIDLIITDHSLEPNAKKLEKILNEIFRCAKKYCVFIEPSNELQSKEGVERMKSLGYIFDLEEKISKLGGKIKLQKNIENNYKELNKARLLIVKPPELTDLNLSFNKKNSLKNTFTYPGTNFPLVEKNGFFYNNKLGFLFPKINEIPIFLEQKRILATKFEEESSN